MLVFYTEREGGKWKPLRVKTTRGKFLKRLKKFAFKNLAEIVINGEKFFMNGVLFPNDSIYYPMFNKGGRRMFKGMTFFTEDGRYIHIKSFHKWLKGQLGIK